MTIRTEPVTINVGPQHPSTHGVFRLRVTFDGETVVDVEPVFGYLHRGTEKLAEGRSYVQVVTLTDRLDYVASMSNNLAYVRAVEKLGGIEVPERAQYIRAGQTATVTYRACDVSIGEHLYHSVSTWIRQRLNARSAS